MTVYEAEEEVKKCEREITQAHSKLVLAANNMSKNTVYEASRRVTTSTLKSLIISLIGVIVAFCGHPFWGVVLVIVGGFISKRVYDAANEVRSKVETEEKFFKINGINPNEKI